MRVLPKDQREAMFSVYRFCRAVDDVADEPEYGSPERAPERARALAPRHRGDVRRARPRPSLPISTAQRAGTDCGKTISKP